MICFALCAFVLASITQEFARGVAIRRRNTGQSVGSALIGMILRGKRRYGGYLVHIGIMLMFFGWAGSAYQKEKTAKLGPGQTTTIGAYTIRFDKLAHEEDRQKEMVTGEITALVGGKEIRSSAAREVVLPQPRERADDGGRNQARANRGPLHHAGRIRPRRRDRDAEDRSQPMGQLDLVRVHAARARDRHRAGSRQPCWSG